MKSPTFYFLQNAITLIDRDHLFFHNEGFSDIIYVNQEILNLLYSLNFCLPKKLVDSHNSGVNFELV